MISGLISSAFLPGNVRSTTLLFDIFLGFMFLTIESQIKIIGEYLVILFCRYYHGFSSLRFVRTIVVGICELWVRIVVASVAEIHLLMHLK